MKSEMTQESKQSQEKTVGEQAEYMEELEEEQNIAHSENTGSDGGAEMHWQ